MSERRQCRDGVRATQAARDRARYARELEEYKKERLAEQEAEVDSDDEPLMKKPAVKEESSSSDDD